MPTPESELFLAKKPKVPPTFEGVDFLDNQAVADARDAIIREQAVTAMMIKLLGKEMSKCYMREGVNHMANCGKYRDRYLQLLYESRGNKGWRGPQQAYLSKISLPDGTEVPDIQKSYPTVQEGKGAKGTDPRPGLTKGYGPRGEGGPLPIPGGEKS